MKKSFYWPYTLVFFVLISGRTAFLPTLHAQIIQNNQQPKVIQPLLPPHGFGVQDTGRTTNQANPAGYYPFDTATSQQANWAIVAWSNPANLPYFNPFLTLPGFNQNQELTDQNWLASSSENASQNMAFVGNQTLASGVTSTILMQDGLSSNGRCSDAQGNPLEYDFFISPNSPNTNPYYPNAYVTNVKNPYLDKITEINILGSVELLSQMSISDQNLCPIAQSSMIYSLIFSNFFSGQTLFYQLDLNFFCYPGRDPARNSWCSTQTPQMNYFFTGQGNVWGIDDPITNYVNPQTNTPYALLQNTGTMNININFAPRIENLIKNGQYGLDTNLSHWQWGGIYYGQHTWGNTALVSNWVSKNFSPTIIYSP